MMRLPCVLLSLTLFVTSLVAQEPQQTEATPSSAASQEEPLKEDNHPESGDTSVAKKTTPAESDGSGQEFNLKMRSLEEKINSLKDKVFRAKQRLAILQETVLSGALAGARASVIHANDVGSAFELVSLVYYLDEAPVYKWVEGSPVAIKSPMTIFDSSVVPGPHHLSVYLVFRGRGYGLFSYMEGYTFKLKAGYSFNVEEGQLVEVAVSAKDRGALVKLDNRLYISFDINKKMFEETPVVDGTSEAGVK